MRPSFAVEPRAIPIGPVCPASILSPDEREALRPNLHRYTLTHLYHYTLSRLIISIVFKNASACLGLVEHVKDHITRSNTHGQGMLCKALT